MEVEAGTRVVGRLTEEWIVKQQSEESRGV